MLMESRISQLGQQHVLVYMFLILKVTVCGIFSLNNNAVCRRKCILKMWLRSYNFIVGLPDLVGQESNNQQLWKHPAEKQLHTCGTTPKAFLQVCRETELQETPSMEISPSVEARRSRADSRVLLPEPVRPSRPTYTNTQPGQKHFTLCC